MPRRRVVREWIWARLGELAVGLMRGDWRAIAITAAVILIAAVVFYWTVIRPGRRVIPEDRWVAPDSDEVKRLVGPDRGDPSEPGIS